MTDYRYVGVADVVQLSEDDFTRHDVTDQGAVVFNAENDWTAELSEAAAELLKGQGFSLMTSDEFHSFLEDKRKEAAEADRQVALAQPSEAALRAAEEGAPQAPAIPERPSADATRDELADYAWTHYGIPADTAEKRMTKAEITKALDKAE